VTEAVGSLRAVFSADSAQFETTTRRVRTELKATEGAFKASAGAVRAGGIQLANQMSDVAVQFQGGAHAATIFLQQTPQIIQAFSLMTGGGNKLVGFLAGPWGAALTIAGGLAASFASNLMEGSKAADAQSDATKTLEQATKELNDITGIGVQTEAARAAAARRSVIEIRNQEIATRNLIKAQLEQADVSAALASDDPLGSVGAASVDAGVARLEKRLKQQDEKIAAANQAILSSNFPLNFPKAPPPASMPRASSAPRGRAAGDNKPDLGPDLRNTDPRAGFGFESISPLGNPSVMKELDELGDGLKKAWTDSVAAGEDRMKDLADTFESAMSGAGGNFLEQFKRNGIRIVAQIAAGLVTNNGGAGGGLFGAIKAATGLSIGGGGGYAKVGASVLSSAAPIANIGALPGFATGGSFKVGGRGGIDQNLVQFRATRGEMVNITKGENDNGRRQMAIHVEPSPYFDVRVSEVASPMAQAAQIGAVGQVEQRASKRRRRLL
jgi:hypothetical protein